jgi:hypothetical protein
MQIRLASVMVPIVSALFEGTCGNLMNLVQPAPQMV